VEGSFLPALSPS
jgi:hypothetical protein